jgi:hypothetical protein
MLPTVLATLNHVDQEVRIILAVNITFVAILMTWLLLLVRLHILFIGKVAEAVFVGTFDPTRSMSWRLISFAVSGYLQRHLASSECKEKSKRVICTRTLD